MNDPAFVESCFPLSSDDANLDVDFDLAKRERRGSIMFGFAAISSCEGNIIGMDEWTMMDLIRWIGSSQVTAGERRVVLPGVCSFRTTENRR